MSVQDTVMAHFVQESGGRRTMDQKKLLRFLTNMVGVGAAWAVLYLTVTYICTYIGV